jgi:hypothetical protein
LALGIWHAVGTQQICILEDGVMETRYCDERKVTSVATAFLQGKRQ